MKYFILSIAFLFGISLSASAQSTTATPPDVKPKVELKDHVCTDACHKNGHCMLIHGEKGHKCSKECESMHKEAMNNEMKSHKCTSACHDAGHCVYAHGEIGHKYTKECETMHKETMKNEMKKHECTSACHDTGHCVYAHGENGHKCTEACK